MLETDNDHAVVDPDVSQVRNMRTRTGNAKTAAQAGTQALRVAGPACASRLHLTIFANYESTVSTCASMTCKIPAIMLFYVLRPAQLFHLTRLTLDISTSCAGASCMDSHCKLELQAENGQDRACGSAIRRPEILRTFCAPRRCGHGDRACCHLVSGDDSDGV